MADRDTSDSAEAKPGGEYSGTDTQEEEQQQQQQPTEQEDIKSHEAQAEGKEAGHKEEEVAKVASTEAGSDVATSGGSSTPVVSSEKAGGEAEGSSSVGGDGGDREEDRGGRIIYGKDLDKESDSIKFKWNAIFYKFSPEQKARMALDEVSLYSITDTRSAYNTSKIIEGLAGSRAIVTDGCAAAGGNTMSFAEIFQGVNAVEMNKQRFGLLNSNLQVLGYDRKVRTYCGNYLELLETIKQDVVFLDPPWGGMGYVDGDKLDLALGGVPLADLCERLKPHCRFIALKLPLNFNVDGFRRAVTSSFARIDDRSARKQLFIVLDTSGRDYHDKQRGSHKRERDDKPAPWQLKRKS